jgi:hypothetical protein
VRGNSRFLFAGTPNATHCVWRADPSARHVAVVEANLAFGEARQIQTGGSKTLHF